MENQATRNNFALFIVGILFVIWGIFGILDTKNFVYSGYTTDGDNTIIKVEDNSPAAIAGMQAGDVIKKNGGIAVTDTKALSKRERTKIGEVREFVVDREGKDLALQLTFAAIKDKDKTLNMVAFIIGFLFVLLGVYAHNKFKTVLSFSFAIFTLCFGFNFMNGPYFSDNLINRIVNAFGLTVVLFSIAALSNYMLKYPPQSKFLDNKRNLRWLYAPAVGLITFFWVIIIAQPDSTSSLNQIIRLLIGVVLVGYFGLALVTLILKFTKANPEERKALGLNLMLLGAIIGLVPILIVLFTQTISPKTILPGSDYAFISFVAIPIFCTLALIKLEKATDVESK